MSDLTDEMFLSLPDGSKDSPAAPTLDYDRSPVVTVTFAGNRLTRNATRAYQQEFGIGVMDWRMLVMLTRDPGCSVGHAARVTGIDKAAVSRALHRMSQAGLARAEVLGGDERRKSWFLTEAGHALHARILPRALERQRDLLKGFSTEDLKAFTGYLQRFLENMADEDTPPPDENS
ncbi:MarR family winged helix-turn-helix transcriptional regulator [Phaeobacter sp. QD34_3]|uniref:MarR family winged helix-turn-helix transcriptional regulator n=1 Tax=unclassified Phaeobacter TaxID=2621772 RepID=UPI00237F2AE5|nr:MULTISPECIES: MarR family winged helix-turn-helix transcriptional regulator [unclassified Phaeobacter]MDE4132599.1 MarR family winged helix-turn-helix transcriptional regulator [Phaeobacter sp. QD34_3]MDE4136235.1 MarR family winged helix-turn-helix transcriptional regulator [Phaeobacter sp. QD34_24]MDE4174402.1 MarR family winged helix-turn-helix transcriptional regulator [Phaeobacter sp. PT47_59]